MNPRKYVACVQRWSESDIGERMAGPIRRYAYASRTEAEAHVQTAKLDTDHGTHAWIQEDAIEPSAAR